MTQINFKKDLIRIPLSSKFEINFTWRLSQSSRVVHQSSFQNLFSTFINELFYGLEFYHSIRQHDMSYEFQYYKGIDLALWVLTHFKHHPEFRVETACASPGNAVGPFGWHITSPYVNYDFCATPNDLGFPRLTTYMKALECYIFYPQFNRIVESFKRLQFEDNDTQFYCFLALMYIFCNEMPTFPISDMSYHNNILTFHSIYGDRPVVYTEPGGVYCVKGCSIKNWLRSTITNLQKKVLA